MKKNIVVVLNYNDFENTKKFLDSVSAFEIIDEIVVVDNASTDDSVENLKKISNRNVKVIFNKENKGYGAGNNLGIRYIKQKYKTANIIISNPDIEVTEDNLEKLVRVMREHNVKMISPLIKQGNEIIRGWKLTSALDEIKMSLPFINKKKIIGYDDGHFDKAITKVDVLSGCFFIIDSSIIEESLFDENVFLYYEENILSRNINVEKFVYNDAVVKHNHSVTIDKNINKYKKNKILKESQEYYVTTYCNPNIAELLILKILNKLVLLKSKIIG